MQNLIRSHISVAYDIARTMVGERADALDIVQDSLTQALSHGSAPAPEDSQFRAWFCKVVRNKAIDWLRARKRLTSLNNDVIEQMQDDTANEPIWALITRQDKQLVQMVLARLHSHHREIILLKDLHDFSYAELADILELTNGTVMSRLHRARTSFAETLLRLKEE